MQHSGTHSRKATGVVRKGELGKIAFCRTWIVGDSSPRRCGNPPDSPPPAKLHRDMWQGPAPARPFNASLGLRRGHDDRLGRACARHQSDGYGRQTAEVHFDAWRTLMDHRQHGGRSAAELSFVGSCTLCADQIERANPRREGILLRFHFPPVAGRLGVREVTHHLHDIGAVIAMEFQRGRRVILGRLQAEVMPESKRRTVQVMPGNRAPCSFGPG